MYLLVYQHVPVQRCVRLIAELTGGTAPSDGFCHGMLTRCATAVAEVVAAITTLITLAHVVGFDETTLRCGQAGGKVRALRLHRERHRLSPGRGLITAWHAARDTGLPAIAEQVRDELTLEFRHAVRVGLSQVPRVPGPRRSTAQRPGRDLLEFCDDREADVLRFTTDTRIWPTNNISERDLRPTKHNRRSPAG